MRYLLEYWKRTKDDTRWHTFAEVVCDGLFVLEKDIVEMKKDKNVRYCNFHLSELKEIELPNPKQKDPPYCIEHACSYIFHKSVGWVCPFCDWVSRGGTVENEFTEQLKKDLDSFTGIQPPEVKDMMFGGRPVSEIIEEGIDKFEFNKIYPHLKPDKFVAVDSPKTLDKGVKHYRAVMIMKDVIKKREDESPDE